MIVGTGKGLVADFFSDNNLTNLVAARIDATVNFVWGTGSPGTGIPAEGFSTRWTGQVQAQFTQAYTFYTDTAGGVRLFVNGQTVINDWAFHARRTVPGTISLTAGKLYDLQLEYRDQGTSAVRLLWSMRLDPKGSHPDDAALPRRLCRNCRRVARGGHRRQRQGLRQIDRIDHHHRHRAAGDVPADARRPDARQRSDRPGHPPADGQLDDRPGRRVAAQRARPTPRPASAA